MLLPPGTQAKKKEAQLMSRLEAEGENEVNWQIEGPHWNVSHLCR